MRSRCQAITVVLARSIVPMTGVPLIEFSRDELAGREAQQAKTGRGGEALLERGDRRVLEKRRKGGKRDR